MEFSGVWIQKVQEMLLHLPLTEEQLTLVEEYLFEDAEEEILEKIEFRDLSKVKIHSVDSSFLKHLPVRAAQRLFQVLFAIGKSTCADLFSISIFYLSKLDQERELQMKKEQILALYAHRAMNYYPMNSKNEIEEIKKMVDGDAEVVLRAMPYYRERRTDGELFLLALYFFFKYPKAEIQDGTETAVLEEDALLIRRYEAILEDSLEELFCNSLSSKEAEEIRSGLREQKLPQKVLELGKEKAVMQNNLSFLSGYIFLNCALSRYLKNILSLFLVSNPKRVLERMQRMDCRRDLELRGGDFTAIFGLDPIWYISWAAEQNAWKILSVQLQKNRECYLRCCDRESFFVIVKLFDVIRREDKTFYQEIWSAKWGRIQEEIVREMIKDSQVADRVRNYLNGLVGIDSITACAKQLKEDRNKIFMESILSAIVEYRELFEENGFFNRCLVCILISESWWRLYQMIYQNRIRVIRKSPNGIATKIEIGQETEIEIETGSDIEIQTKIKAYDMEQVHQKNIEQLLKRVDAEGLDLQYQLNMVHFAYDYYAVNGRKKEVFLSTVKKRFLYDLSERREQTIAAFFEADRFGRYFGLSVLEEEAEQNKEAILKFSQDSAKTAREKLIEILSKHPEWEAEVMERFSSKKAAEREIAVRVLLSWDTSRYEKELREGWKKEKSAKIRALLGNALGNELELEENVLKFKEGEGQENRCETGKDKAQMQKELVQRLWKGGKKRTLAWAYQEQEPFPVVHKIDNEEASEEYLQAILLCYASMGKNCGVNQEAAFLAEALNQAEFTVYLMEWLTRWIAAKADTKKRYVLYAAVIHGGSEIVRKLQQSIQEWEQRSRAALAAEAVHALSLSSSPQSLFAVDEIARKSKRRQVKEAAEQELKQAAVRMGLTREELADRLVPDFGFDSNREKRFDYGERIFTAVLTSEMELEVYDAKGKKLKNLPAIGKRDDAEKAAAACQEWKRIKKQVKEAINDQKKRLEKGFFSGREWKIEAWKELFVKNPLMYSFAVGLVWGIYQDGELKQSFRYREDGSFNTVEEEEYFLPENGRIGLVHPLELSKEVLAAWKEQFADYEMTQPIEQIERLVYYRTEEEMEQTQIKRFSGQVVSGERFFGLLKTGWEQKTAYGNVRSDWKRIVREERELGICVECSFSGGNHFDYEEWKIEDVTLGEIQFYPIVLEEWEQGGVEGFSEREESVKPKDFSEQGTVVDSKDFADREEGNKDMVYWLRDLSERCFSEVVREFSLIVE